MKMDHSTIAIIIMIVTMILFITELIPLPVTALGTCLAMSITGVMSYKDAFSGFANDTLFMVIGAMVIGDSLFATGAAQDLGRAIMRLTGTNERRFLIASIILTGFLSAFLSNTAVTAMMIPIVGAISVSSQGKIQRKNCMIGIGYAAVAGGACTLVGSTPQLVAQGILQEYGLEGMGFFDLTLSGVLRMAIIALYFPTFGYHLMKKHLDFEDNVQSETPMETTGGQGMTPKKIISIVIIILAVIGFITQIWTVGTVAMVGALLCILTGCISFKDVIHGMDWVTVIVLGGSLGFAVGVEKSGAGLLIANTIIGIAGENISPWVLYGAVAIICIILGNIMSHTATAAAMCPIVITLAQELGLNPVSMVICVIISVCAAYVNPVATPPLTMTLTAGYRFKDYIRIGWPLQVLVSLFTVLALPILLEF